MPGKDKTSEIQPKQIHEICWGFNRAQALSTAIDLELFTKIDQGQVTPEKLSAGLNCTRRAIRLLMDALVGMSLLVKTKGVYKLGSEAKVFLVKSSAQYLGNSLRLSDRVYQDWSKLTEVIRQGAPLAPSMDPSAKNKFFQELVPSLFASSFASAMILTKKLGVGKSLCDLNILDLGCGTAAWSLPFALLDSGSSVTAVDSEEVLEVAHGFIKKYHVQSQYRLLPGDYHRLDLPRESYDVILLGHICHMEGESGTRSLLKRCFETLKPGGRLLIAEFIANDLKTGPGIPLLFGLNMLLYTEQGDVFSAKELKNWLQLAKFKKVLLQTVQYPVSVLMAVK